MSDILNRIVQSGTTSPSVNLAQLEAQKQGLGGDTEQQTLDGTVNLSQIETQKREVERKQKEQAEYRASESEFLKNNVKLNTGEYVSKEFYNSLSTEEQDKLNQVGVTEYNKYYEEKQKVAKLEFEEKNIRLSTGEYISKADYDKLSEQQKQTLMDKGIEAFNKEVEAFNKLHNEGVKLEGKYQTYQVKPKVTQLYDTKGKLLNDYQLVFADPNKYVVVYSGEGEIIPEYTGGQGNLRLVLREYLPSYLELVNKLPKGWEIGGFQEDTSLKGFTYYVQLKDPSGKITPIPLNIAVNQLTKDGVITLPKTFDIPPIKDIPEVVDKDSYKIIPPSYQGGQELATFKIDGTEYNVSPLYANWYANLLKNVGKDKYYTNVSAPTYTGGMWQTPTVLLTDKNGVSKGYTIDKAWAMVMTDGQAELEEYKPETPQYFQAGRIYASSEGLTPTTLGGDYGKVSKAVTPPSYTTTAYKEFNPQIGMPQLSNTLDLVNQLNAGTIKESELTQQQAELLNKEAVRIADGKLTLKTDYAESKDLVVTPEGKFMTKLDAQNVGVFEANHVAIGNQGQYMKLDDYNKLLDRGEGATLQSIVKADGIEGLETHLKNQEKKLEPYMYTDVNTDKKEFDIITAIRDSIKNPELSAALNSLYTKEELNKVTENRVIEPKNWIEQLQVWGEEVSNPRLLQKQTKETVEKINEIFGSALSRIVEIEVEGEKTRDDFIRSKIGEDAYKTFKELSGSLVDTIGVKGAKEYAENVNTLAQKVELGKEVLKGSPVWTQIPSGFVVGALETITTVPASIGSALHTTFANYYQGISTQDKEERDKLIQRGVLTTLGLGAGMASWFAGRPLAVSTSPFESTYTVGMMAGAEKLADVARALEVKINPSKFSNTALALEIDVNRIEVPKDMTVAQATQYISDIQNKIAEGQRTALRENRDVIINDPISGKAIGHVTAFEQAVKGTTFHASPDMYKNFVKQINETGQIKVSEADAVNYGGLFTSQQSAYSFLGRRQPKDPSILAIRLTPEDIAQTPAKVQDLMWKGKLAEARDLFVKMGVQGKLEPKAYTPFKSYTKDGKLIVEQEVWLAPGFTMKATPKKWYAKESGVETAVTKTTSPISIGGKPIARNRATAVVIDKNNEVLLVKDAGKDYYSLPGGEFKKGESPLDAVLRELKEETGLDYKNARKSGKYTDKEPLYDQNGNVVYIEGRPAYNEHTIYTIKVDSFDRAKTKGELIGIGKAKVDSLLNNKGHYEGYVPQVIGKATNKRAVQQQKFDWKLAELKYGQEVPMLWLASENALKEGLGVPTVAQKYKTELINLVVDARKMLPWHIRFNRVTIDPEAPSRGSWIGSNLTGIKLEAGRGKGEVTAKVKKGTEEKLTRNDERAIDDIVREVNNKAIERTNKGEQYDKAFADEANKIADDLVRDLPYKLNPKLRLPVESIPDTVDEGSQYINKELSDSIKLQESKQKEVIKEEIQTPQEKIQAEKTSIESKPAEKEYVDKTITEKPISEQTLKEKQQPEKQTTEKTVPEIISKRGAIPEKTTTKEPLPTKYPPEEPPKEGIEVPPIPPVSLPPPPIKPPRLELPNGIKLTPKQTLGIVAWKQGVMYKLTYPPYGQRDIYNSPKKIPEVEYHDDIGSATRSMVAKYGEIPKRIHRHMGVVDIDIFKTKNEEKPRPVFREKYQTSGGRKHTHRKQQRKETNSFSQLMRGA